MTSEAADYLTRARRAHGEPGGAFTEIYTWALALLLLAVMTTSGWGDVLARGTCTGAGCVHGGGATAAIALGLLVLAGIARLAVAFGPVGAGAPQLTWLLSGPAPRRPVLRGRLWVMAIGLSVLGSLCGPAVLATGGLPVLPHALAWGIPAGAVAALLVTAGVAAAQSDPRARRRAARAPLALGLVGVACAGFARLATALGTSGGDVTAGAGGAGSAVGALGSLAAQAGPLAAGLLALGLVAALALLVRADRRIDEVDGIELRRAGESSGAAYESALMMDAGAAMHRAAQSRLGARGSFRSRRGRGTGLAALLLRDLERVRRQGDRLLLGIPLLVAGALLAAMAPPVVTLPALGLGAAVLARSVGEGLGAWALSSGLRRDLPLPDDAVRLAHLVGPVVVAAAWSGLVVPLVGLSWWVAPALVLSATASLLASSRPMGLEMMAVMIPTPFGLAPAGALGVARGYETATLAMLGPALMPGPAAPAIPLLALAWQWCRCSADRRR
ncbi:DUF6297 family protein [Arsenicicoccus cauae]|uniref:DUF6297 family protein n=1 Tax=Arsenicicoccus cauae TaxID=2663847 RepID=UPI00370D8D8E